MKGAELAAWDAMSASIIQARSIALLLAMCGDMSKDERAAFQGLVTILQPGVDALAQAEPKAYAEYRREPKTD